MGFPFVSSGLLLRKLQDKLGDCKKWLYFSWVVVAIVFIVEIYLVRYFSIAVSVTITLGLYPLLILTMLILLNNPLDRYSECAGIFRTIANVTYYAHPLLIQLFAIASSILDIKIPNLLVIACTVALTFIVGVVFSIILKRTGNRAIKNIVKVFVG